MPEAKRPDPKRRSPAGRPKGAAPARRKPRATDSAIGTGGVRRDEKPKETIREAIAASAEQQSEQRFGSAARRAAILAAVICVLTLTIAGPVRTYFAQRTEMKQLKATEEQLRTQIADLEEQKVKLGDPVFIAAQARERLGFVMPGDIPYQVQLPATRGCAEPHRAANPRRRTRDQPWYTSLWHTIADAPHGVSPTTVPDAPPPGPSRHLLRPARPLPVVEPADLDAVARQLGRDSRGVLEIAYRCPNGEPGVVKTAPRLPDGTPFPTLYYLTHPVLTAAASRLESAGLMREMTERLQQDRELAAAYRRAHESYLAERDAIEPLGTTFSGGGMPERVKCLHVLIAHSLAKGPGVNPFGDEALAVLADEPEAGLGEGMILRRTKVERAKSSWRRDRLRHQLDPTLDRRQGRRPPARCTPRDAHRAVGSRRRCHRAIRA